MINNFSIFSDISLTNNDHSLLECKKLDRSDDAIV